MLVSPKGPKLPVSQTIAGNTGNSNGNEKGFQTNDVIWTVSQTIAGNTGNSNGNEKGFQTNDVIWTVSQKKDGRTKIEC